MPRKSGTDVLFPKWTRPAVFSAGRVLFFGCCFIRPGLWRVAAPVCGALLLRSVLRRCSRLVPCRCSALCRVVILGLHRSPSPFVPCRRSRLVPCRCSALCRVVILGLHRSPSPFVPCRRSDLRRIVIRCLRRVAVPVCGWPPPENSADGLAGNLCGLRGSCGLSLRCGDSGRVARPLFCSS